MADTPIAGLSVLPLQVHEDARGWFKENWNNARTPFRPVQNNVSFNDAKGTTRGLHAEPWDKIVSVAAGRVFGAWMDLREGSETFGETYTHEIGPDTAVFVPRGVANGFQALEDGTAYTYLVNDHWSADARYVNVSYKNVDWPLEPINLSEKDLAHPMTVDPMPGKKILVTGADGQLGRALRTILGDRGEFNSRVEFDVTDPPTRNWRQYEAIVNAAAYNAVDDAENDRAQAWAVNATGPARLARIAAENDVTFVHVSTDYVFDGSRDSYAETDPVSPLNFYGATKAAGDTAAQTAPKHYVVRTQWVYGDGGNFVDAMRSLAEKGVEPKVVHDQVGRVTSAEDLAKAIVHLLDTGAEYGVYNVTGTGDPAPRDEIAMAVFIALGHDPSEVHPVTTAEYHGDEPHAVRPSRTVLDTSKIEAAGFTPTNWRVGLALYLA